MSESTEGRFNPEKQLLNDAITLAEKGAEQTSVLEGLCDILKDLAEGRKTLEDISGYLDWYLSILPSGVTTAVEGKDHNETTKNMDDPDSLLSISRELWVKLRTLRGK